MVAGRSREIQGVHGCIDLPGGKPHDKWFCKLEWLVFDVNSALNHMFGVFGLRPGPGEGARSREAARHPSNGMCPSCRPGYGIIQGSNGNGEAFAAAFETGVELS